MSMLALYVQGDIYPPGANDPPAAAAAIPSSSLAPPTLALSHVNCPSQTCPGSTSTAGGVDADIAFNDTLVVRGVQCVGDPSWPAVVNSLRAGLVTKISP